VVSVSVVLLDDRWWVGWIVGFGAIGGICVVRSVVTLVGNARGGGKEEEAAAIGAKIGGDDVSNRGGGGGSGSGIGGSGVAANGHGSAGSLSGIV
jgi:hypothetical protein